MSIRYVGLDVHKDSIGIAVAESGRARARYLGSVGPEKSSLLKQLHKLSEDRALRCCYEAGPGGYALHRQLTSAGIDCTVIAPSLIPRRSGDRVKTDRLDAENLAHFFRSGDLREVWVPDTGTEGVRDIVRLRYTRKRTLQKARQRLNHFLLKHGCRYPGKTLWCVSHVRWIRKQRFDDESLNLVHSHRLREIEVAGEQLKAVEDDLRVTCESWSRNPLVQSLQAFRGIGFLGAVTIVAETGDFWRFSSAPKLMSYYGLVPTEYSSGNYQKRGSITRCGNKSVRRILVEAAWHYRHRPSESREIKNRSQDLPQRIRDIAWKAQERLHRRYYRLVNRGKSTQKACVAVARELTGFIWAISREVDSI